MNVQETNCTERPGWLSWAVLGLLLIVALALRWRYIEEISLFVDEFVTAWAARNVLSKGLPIFPSGNFYPHGFLFTYLEAPFVLGEFNETLSRIPGLIVSLVSIPLVYWVGRRLFSNQVGLIAAAVMVVDPDCIVWGGRARMYGLLQLLTLLTVFFYYRGLAGDRARDRYLAMGLLVAAVFTHLEAAFLLPVLAVATLVVVPWRQLFRWSVILPFFLGAAGVVVFLLISYFGQPGHLVTLEQEGRSYLDLAAGILLGPRAFAPVFTNPHRLPFTLLGLVGLYYLFWPRFDRHAPLTYLYVVVITLLLLLVLLAGATWQRERYLFLMLPLLFLIGGEVLTRLLSLIPALRHPRPWQSALLAIAVTLFVALVGAPSAYVEEWGYDRAFRYLRDEAKLGATDRIITSMSTAANLYLGRNDAFAIQQGYEEYVVALPDRGTLVDLWTATPVLTTTAGFAELLGAAPRVWFVTDGWRLQTRYEPEFLLTVLDQMELVYNDGGVMVFLGEGYTPSAEPAIWQERRAEFGDELALTGFGLSPADSQPGETLEVILHWQALEQAGPAYTALLHLVGPDGVGVAGLDEPVLGGFYQADLWPRDMTLPDRHDLPLPADLPPGRYRLELGLYPPGHDSAPLLVGDTDRLPLALVTIGETNPPPPGTTNVYLDYDHQIRLLGYDLSRPSQGTGSAFDLTLTWQALAPVDRDYTVFAHLVDSDGTIITQDDGPPGDPFFPTSTWLPGTVILDARSLVLPAGAPSGDYHILVGLYYAPTDERLSITDAHGQPQGDAFRLGPLSVTGESP